MPKRHRQPEPIDMESTAHRSSRHATLADSSRPRAAPDASVSQPVYSPGEQKLVEETRKKARDFPATPETLTRHRRQQEASEKRRRLSYDRDGQPLADTVAAARRDDGPAGTTTALPGTAGSRSSAVDFSTASPGRLSLSESDVLDMASGDGAVASSSLSVDGSDLSSQDYIGDDGNQPSSESEPDSSGSDDDEGEEADLRGLRRAVAAAAAARRGPAAASQEDARSSSGSSDWMGGSEGEEEEEEEEDGGSDSDDGEAFTESDDEEEEEEDEEGDSSDEEEEGEEETSGQGQSARRGKKLAGDSDDDDDDDDDDADGGLITVDFGVFDMEKSNIDGLIHLMDQLCPDKMNEVDRDELGLALLESPFTSVVRLQNNGEDETGEEEQEFYGLSSILDLAHGRTLYPAALRPLCDLLQQHVWRQAASGIPPTDILTSVVDDEKVMSSRAKCLLLVSEYIRNIPLELTVQILEDVLNRLDAAGAEQQGGKQKAASSATHDHPIHAVQPSMFAILAKVQRATDAPVTLPKSGAAQQQQQHEEAGSSSSPHSGAAKRAHHHGTKKGEKASGAGGSAMSAPEAPLDLSHYIFWREEDSILYEFRDKRVAALVYRCRPQYDGQPEHEIPLSLLFVLQYGAMRQAVDEMKRRQTVNAAIERY